jgi:hypothetical protein
MSLWGDYPHVLVSILTCNMAYKNNWQPVLILKNGIMQNAAVLPDGSTRPPRITSSNAQRYTKSFLCQAVFFREFEIGGEMGYTVVGLMNNNMPVTSNNLVTLVS